jgi:hypothetical protein
MTRSVEDIKVESDGSCVEIIVNVPLLEDKYQWHGLARLR